MRTFKNPKKIKVVVGMSGGVDSAVAAYLLKKQGYQVSALFMRNWDSAVNNDAEGQAKTKKNSVCPEEQDYEDAKKTCERLGIELFRIDFVKEYWEYVFEYFISEYNAGRTPNPDILCNKYIKFDMFLKYAVNFLEADYIAMGHYADIIEQDGQCFLRIPTDVEKDQTYFLTQLTQYQLSKSIFPLGDIKKTEVRKIAKDIKLPVANKKDSTGICFIGEREFKTFLKNYIPAKPGKIIDIISGKLLGTHDGIMYYTIGQRKGLNLGGSSQKYYVCGKKADEAVLYVAPISAPDLLESDICEVFNINWINDIRETIIEAKAKFRYRQELIDVRIEKIDEKSAYVYFSKPIKAITPGQSAAFYMGDICLGGGTIETVFKKVDNQILKIGYL